ncbi:HAMP domain-containing histidine kinase [Candidatus Kaiserbacteria bacterium]|nr:HAMP domain-containing histidine kinase [Candidatus Kaiserbacteria bacterium]
MADQIEQGVRISTPPSTSQTVTRPRRLFPLSVKLLLFMLLGIGILSTLLFFVPFFQTHADLSRALILLTIWSLYLLAVTHFLFIHPVHTLLTWFKQSRDVNYERVSPPPVQSSDEIGNMAQSMSAAISAIWQAGEHERELLQHKSDTITLIEHQLRTALTQLKWSLETVQVPTEVTGAVARISGTVQDIINAARIGEGRFGYVFAEADLKPIVEKLVESTRSHADSRGVKLVFESAPDIPPVLADADRISIALSNVLSNAIEYTPSGGTVSISITQVDEFVDITIKDTGIGMSQEDLANLFGKMHRGKVAMKMRPDGSGLGLYVAKNIFNEHGAEVMVKSEEGKGTQFSVRIHKVLSAHK